MKHTEQVNPQTEKADWWFPGLGEERALGIMLSFWDNENREAVAVTQHCCQKPPKRPVKRLRRYALCTFYFKKRGRMKLDSSSSQEGPVLCPEWAELSEGRSNRK